MHSAKQILWAFLFVMPLLMGSSVSANIVDDTIPEVTARVARISFIRGEVQIRRDGSQDWERAVLNLPVVEGDEITTDTGARFEIQFNSYTHLRVAEKSYFKLVSLKDEGIAVSLSEGNLILRLSAFDKDRSFFEIDAPKITVAVQKAGYYRIDAGNKDFREVRVTATADGEARIYSESSGFNLKNGRSAKIFLEGNLAGEWETAAADRYADEFDTWSLERDAVIAKSLKDSHYDKYYDRDIYGADDLNEYGEWVHTRKYGYVWKPYRNSLSHYADWSPYRYGHWRWVPPYGWTWVNDEPWGWATYHHGRWIYDNGGWYWTPYGYVRNRRSWWRPALVVVSILNNNICWYPLPYNYGYYNYNYYYSSHYYNRRRRDNDPPPFGGGPPPVTPPPVTNGRKITPERMPFEIDPNQPPVTGGQPGKIIDRLPFEQVPPTGVVSIPASEFGRTKIGFRSPPETIAKEVLSKMPDERRRPAILPVYSDLNGKVSREIRSERPFAKVDNMTQTGAAKRVSDAPMDQELRKTRILGNREPLPVVRGSGDVKIVPADNPEPRKTGAVERPVGRREMPVNQQPPAYIPPPQSEEPKQPRERPRPAPQPRQEEPRYEKPKQESPRFDPKPRSEEPREEKVRQPDPPRYELPRNDPPPPKNDAPPPKSDGKPPEASSRKSKDGRK